MRVLVTGAAGFLGKAVCEHLSETGWDVRPTDRAAGDDAPNGLHVADLLDEGAATETITGCEAVVHLANHTGPAGPGGVRVYRDNCAMNVHVFQAALEAGVRRIIYASSTQVFAGDRSADEAHRPSCLPYLPLDGAVPPWPGNLYGASKEAGEALLRYGARRSPELSATAIRWPLLVDAAELEWYRHRIPANGPKPGNLLDVGFTLLALPDAAALVRSVLEAQPAGYHSILPATPQNRLGWPIATVIDRFYGDVPLRVAADEMSSLIDTEPFRALGWWPEHSQLW